MGMLGKILFLLVLLPSWDGWHTSLVLLSYRLILLLPHIRLLYLHRHIANLCNFVSLVVNANLRLPLLLPLRLVLFSRGVRNLMGMTTLTQKIFHYHRHYLSRLRLGITYVISILWGISTCYMIRGSTTRRLSICGIYALQLQQLRRRHYRHPPLHFIKNNHRLLHPFRPMLLRIRRHPPSIHFKLLHGRNTCWYRALWRAPIHLCLLRPQ